MSQKHMEFLLVIYNGGIIFLLGMKKPAAAFATAGSVRFNKGSAA